MEEGFQDIIAKLQSERKKHPVVGCCCPNLRGPTGPTGPSGGPTGPTGPTVT